MTVIAWDGDSLAADKLICAGDMKSTGCKIRELQHERNKLAVAYYGNVVHAEMMIDWFCAGADPDDFPIEVEQGETGIIVAYPDGRCFEYEGMPKPMQVLDTYHAWGSGSPYALGAMAAGATAEQAVIHANYHATTCGRGVDVICLRP